MHPVKRLQQELPQVWIKQGELFVAKEPSLVTTILGSCITICLHHPHQQTGAMCHCQLPSAGSDQDENPLRYVDKTLPAMLNKLDKLGVSSHGLQAKLFGGAKITDIGDHGRLHNRIGPANVEKARQLLHHYNIPLVAECIGGNKGYKLFFHSATGEVFLSRL